MRDQPPAEAVESLVGTPAVDQIGRRPQILRAGGDHDFVEVAGPGDDLLRVAGGQVGGGAFGHLARGGGPIGGRSVDDRPEVVGSHGQDPASRVRQKSGRQDGRVRPISLPDVAYGATAVRPQWSDLPESLRRAISGRLGAPVVSAQSAGGGFTRAFAAVLSTSAGPSAFVKAASLQDPNSRSYAREAALTSALPPAVAAARPRWTMVDSGYFVLCLEAVDGRVPSLPWSPPELEATLSAWSAAAEALRGPTPELLAVGVPTLPDVVRGEMSWWSAIETGREPLPRTARETVAPARLCELAALERGLPALAAGTGLTHGDLRIDNVLIDREGRA